MKPIVVFIIILLVTPVFLAGAQAQTTQDTAKIDLSSPRWDRSTLHVLIIEAPNESWWNPEFVNATKNAVSNWKTALNFFSDNYPEFSYLSGLTFDFTVSQQTIAGYDVYISFAQTIPQQNQFVLGQTTTYPTTANKIDHCTIVLATKSQTLSFNTDGMMSVATHEFGHVLGLGHSNSTADLMYPSNDLIFSENKVSTLDLYGVAVLFNWLNGDSPPTPHTGSITLPSNIAFEYAPITYTSSTPQGNAFNFLAEAAAFIEQNTVALLFIMAGICFLVALAIVLRAKLPQRKQYIAEEA